MTSIVISTTIAWTSTAAVAMVGLIIFLIARELADARKESNTRMGLLSRHLAAFAVPLLIVFAFIVIMAVLEVID